ncbi:MAG: EscN/YscN/HrcN family type III secretion system ATPase, partial [Candidatus Marinamargulisbacteria bacterium]
REILAHYEEAEDLINIGAYVKGSNPKVDEAIDKIDEVNAFLKQRTDEDIPFDETKQMLATIFE